MKDVNVFFHEGPLSAAALPLACHGAGAVIAFEGRVRLLEDGRSIAALDYEIYEPMARRILGRLAEETVARHGLIAICVEHSYGRVGVGQCSFRLQVAAPHRQEAIAAMACFIDRLKQDVPIWKTAIAAETP